jgi:hypothetical protein
VPGLRPMPEPSTIVLPSAFFFSAALARRLHDQLVLAVGFDGILGLLFFFARNAPGYLIAQGCKMGQRRNRFDAVWVLYLKVEQSLPFALPNILLHANHNTYVHYHRNRF